MKSISALPPGDHHERHFEARMIHVDYQLAMIATFMVAPLRRIPSNSPVPDFERMAHESVQLLARWRTRARAKDLRQLAGLLSDGLLELLTITYSDQARTWNKDHRAGPFSAIRLPEFALLAHRDPSTISLYGPKNVESVFEQQLALILQSLGFIVIQTRRGDRTVDLVCISPDPTCPMTILVEAKTSKGEYKLPTSDQRALLEYAKNVRTNLTTLPALAFVLIVAPSVSTSVERRLSTLEASAGVPVRLMQAKHLAELREAIPGPIRVPTFRSAVLESPHRVLSSVTKIIAEESRNIALAHETLVRAYLPATRERSVGGDDWEHDHIPNDTTAKDTQR